LNENQCLRKEKAAEGGAIGGTERRTGKRPRAARYYDGRRRDATAIEANECVTRKNDRATFPASPGRKAAGVRSGKAGRRPGGTPAQKKSARHDGESQKWPATAMDKTKAADAPGMRIAAAWRRDEGAHGKIKTKTAERNRCRKNE
jgi:hypothetical protein